MCATIGLENVIVKMLHTKAQSSDANVPNGAKLLISQCPGFTLKGYFLGFIPRQQGLHAICQLRQLGHGQIAGRTASKVNEFGKPSTDEWLLGISFELLDGSIEVAVDRCSILIRVDLEVAEVASFSTKWDVKVQPQGGIRKRRTFQSLLVLIDKRRLPE